ncbi:hypothetical protein GE21DRAFT_4218 [Neurospora crassa]|uniref:Transcription regulator Rua1 C-terminal domain-containing protein n=1 Tax=Neurospora crassa (strain ATCC 24698 / 74-OR23-1A / CBS 708.71 / DSM 1257 / FGSC 987) TaxID=367110 RepID=Q7SBS1_NEUCR|nr:hypothetical protein NCU06235 [Neurospora crassa OR74A]EAA33850.2 hypothetical protein NCU06235 [Neurospora crassa OR74A]KHE87071.1 hypothetical protein GE21DRAFT_4218 [Neurospora crassa]|eukprot:XP_963086.2 hypothetical protein NCU06235 [Neurospora crassa OR74A]
MDANQEQSRRRLPFSFGFSKGQEVSFHHQDTISTMPGNQLTTEMEAMAPTHGMWTNPTSHGIKPRPATIHEGFAYSMGGGFGTLPAWTQPSLNIPQAQHTPSDAMFPPTSMPHEFYPQTTDAWGQRHCGEHVDIPPLDEDLAIGQAFTSDEVVPMDLQYQGHQQLEGDQMNYDGGLNQRRMSGSSFSLSTSGAFSDMPSYDEFSATFSDAQSVSDYRPTSNRNSYMSSTHLSPVASPRMTPQTRSDLVRTQSRGRASPSPRPGARAAPYSVDGGRSKRWSTGSYGTAASRRPSPFVYHHGSQEPFHSQPRMPTHHSSPTVAQPQLPLSFGNLQAVQQNPYLLGSNGPVLQHSTMLLPSHLPSHGFHPVQHHFEQPPPLLSHGFFRMLSSNADPSSLHHHYADLSDPPDLFAALQEEQLDPPPEDMNPDDPEMVPHEQELRFDGDLYTPKWVRGHGNKREGWCGICKPGRWLVLKNSAYWYDKSFTHGISAPTGCRFQEPQKIRRMEGNPEVWEGFCGTCRDWVALVSNKKKGTTWFRHAYKCHTHTKIKETPKRRRGSSHTRPSSMIKGKAEPQIASPLGGQMQDSSIAETPSLSQTSGESQFEQA